MGQILITGETSYIGNELRKYLEGKYQVTMLSVHGKEWESLDFRKFNIVIHCAALVHRKERKSQAGEYKEINCNLTKKLAEKSKKEGVGQFIFFSTMSVYGISTGSIGRGTKPNPKSLYGISKLQAEQELLALKSETFRVCIVRPPMIYGKGAKGNYKKLETLIVRIPVFPVIKNKRSMLYIGNLCKFVQRLIEEKADGIFHPQNKEYLSTTRLVKWIAYVHGKKIRFFHLPRWCGYFFIKTRIGQKLFGDLVYKEDMGDRL